jgi:hypothetical protein
MSPKTEENLGALGMVLLMVLLLMILFAGCKTITRTEYVPVEVKEIETVEVVDTVYEVPVPESHDSVAVADTTSYLHNAVAYSYASYTDGMLHHSLGINPMAKLTVEVPHYEVRTKYVEKPVIQTKTVEVEKKLTLWQKVKLWVGETLLLLLFGAAVYIVRLKIEIHNKNKL